MVSQPYVLEDCIPIRARVQQRDVPLFGSGSNWLMTILEFTVVDEAATGSKLATPARSRRHGEVIIVFESEVALFERRLVFQFDVDGDNSHRTRVSMRVAPIAATLAPLNANV